MKIQKHAMYSLLAVSALALSPVALAGTFDLGNYILGPGESAGGSFFQDTAGTAVTISFDYSEGATPDGSWASDARFILLGPSGAVIDVGGFDNPVNVPGPWSFDGAGSDLDGFYSSTFVLNTGIGSFDWLLTNDWGADPAANSYNNLTVSIEKVPVPAAFLLFGSALLGLFGVRSRRS